MICFGEFRRAPETQYIGARDGELATRRGIPRAFYKRAGAAHGHGVGGVLTCGLYKWPVATPPRFTAGVRPINPPSPLRLAAACVFGDVAEISFGVGPFGFSDAIASGTRRIAPGIALLGTRGGRASDIPGGYAVFIVSKASEQVASLGRADY